MRPLEWFVIVSMILLAIAIFEFTKRRHLKEDYSLLWLLACVVVLIVTVWRGLLFYLSSLLGVGEFTIVPVVVIGAILLLVINLHFAVKISKQSEMIRILSENQAIQEYRSKHRKNRNEKEGFT